MLNLGFMIVLRWPGTVRVRSLDEAAAPHVTCVPVFRRNFSVRARHRKHAVGDVPVGQGGQVGGTPVRRVDDDDLRPDPLPDLAEMRLRSEEHTSELQSLMRISY